MNKSIMMGHLVRDPEIRYSQTNNGELAIANFRLAVNRKYVRDGEQEADFFKCTAFGRKAEFVADYLFQGIKVIVEGRMQNDNYTNRDGEKVYGVCLMVEDVDFAESKKVSEERQKQERRDGDNSGRRESREGSGRSSRSDSSSRERDPERGRRSGSSRRSARDEDYEDDREEERDSGRRNSSRRTAGSRSSGSSASSRRGRSVDEEYMEAPDEEVDFD